MGAGIPVAAADEPGPAPYTWQELVLRPEDGHYGRKAHFMAVGKREQIVGLSIGVLASIFLIHVIIFNPKANEFAEVQARYTEGVNQLKDAEVPPSPQWLKKEVEKTTTYLEQVTSVVAQLNLAVPQYFVDSKTEDYLKRYEDFLGLLKQLVKMRDTMQQPKLTFLGDRRLPSNPWEQLGWNLPSQLPLFERTGDRARARAQLWDLITQLENHWTVANNIADPHMRMQYRVKYNEYLQQLGMNPAELSDFIYRPNANTAVFFNDKKLFEQFGSAAMVNPLSINRFGVFLPEIKKMWMLELIWEQHDPSVRITRDKLNEILEINLPFDEKMLFINKQLQALIDIIRIAEKANVQEITEVRMMKPADFTKLERREPGKTPPPETAAAATPAPDPGMMDPGAFAGDVMAGGMPQQPAAAPAGERVAKGSGLEIYFRATNPSTFDFLFDVTTMPRTYALDDLYIQAGQDNMLVTSTTVELLMRLEQASAEM